MRGDQPRNLIRHGGDIDNRIKALFDAMRILATAEIVDFPDPDPDPFFCLLEDDKLIAEVKVTTDRLFAPQEPGEHIHDVHLVIHVRSL